MSWLMLNQVLDSFTASFSACGLAVMAHRPRCILAYLLQLCQQCYPEQQQKMHNHPPGAAPGNTMTSGVYVYNASQVLPANGLLNSLCINHHACYVKWENLQQSHVGLPLLLHQKSDTL